jgi:hypothetical protein
MTPRRALVLLSTAQLAAGLAGQLLALRRRTPFDLPFATGQPEHVGRDSWWMGTAYSAPAPMLAAQAAAIVRLAQGPSDGARRSLGGLGATMVPGYLMERAGRQRLRRSGWDAAETPIAVAGLALAMAMALLGHQARSGA